MTRNLAARSFERAEKLLRGNSVPRHAELARVARGLCGVLRDAGLDRTVLGCVWQDGVFGDGLVAAAVELAKELDASAAVAVARERMPTQVGSSGSRNSIPYYWGTSWVQHFLHRPVCRVDSSLSDNPWKFNRSGKVFQNSAQS